MKWYFLLQNKVHIRLYITKKLYQAILINILQINETFDLLKQMLTIQNQVIFLLGWC